MITHVQATQDKPISWLIENPHFTLVNVWKYRDSSGVFVLTQGLDYVIDHRVFMAPAKFSVVLPTGKWLVEFSDNGKKFHEVNHINSVENNARVTVVVDGNKQPPVWERYTRIFGNIVTA